ncbi:MAG: NAD(P)/FAD-dependent oxidoreductase [Bacteroidales bacterium]|nr:NAD(P)/FAD-dependent oxidoreductase [Bacteroidales bacterium]
MKYDAIVVGGGIAGLTAAAYLSKAGKSVALFERQNKLGGLVQTFQRNGIYFDGGLRSIENSGIVFPMLKQLEIDIEFKKSNVSIGIGNTVLRLAGKESLAEYETFLKYFYPENNSDISAIIAEIKKIMGYMDVLYGIDNPAFLDLMKEKKYLFKVILPWMFKFMFTISKISKLNEPVEKYLTRFTKNQSLIDIIAQHFFQQTPTSFALSYFSLYLDYHYPKGGTASLIEKMEEYIVQKNVVIETNTEIVSLNPEEKYIVDKQGNKSEYEDLIWAGDLKLLYNSVAIEELKDKKLVQKIGEKQKALKPLHGGDSVFTVYLSVNEKKGHFSNICTGHFFYTPDKKGLTFSNKAQINEFLNLQDIQPDNNELKNIVKKYLEDYFKYNTFEIAIPVIRDSNLAPEGKTGIIVSLLFDYKLAEKIDEHGWTNEFKEFMEQLTIQILDESIFPGLKSKVFDSFSSSPLTIEKLTGNSHGGITGWAFTNPNMPVVNKMLKVSKSVDTILPSVYQAGQWVYSPSGLPISILTGKLAADKVI